MNWTNEQEQAISQRNKNIIVSAAAGSGKTAVLVERIRRIVIDEGVPIDRMLIVTFTNAAAAEMKEKIRNSLMKEMEEHPDKAALIKAQIDRLPMAYISTFHSFALRVIRRFFYLADVEAKFKICDEERKHLLKEDALDDTIENALTSGNEKLFEFFDSYSSDRNFSNVRDIISSLYNKVTAHPDRFDILEGFIDALIVSRDEFAASPLAESITKIVFAELERAGEYCRSTIKLLNDSDLCRMADIVKSGELSVIEELCSESNLENAFDKIRAVLANYKFPVLRAKKDESQDYNIIKGTVKELRDNVKGIFSDLYNEFFVDTLDDTLDYMAKTSEAAKALAELTKKFEENFSERKRQLHLLDFNDIEHLCLEILENEEAGNYYKEKFEYILIDEFQDTNLIQDRIISKIRDEKNLFMVGDIKQSIYKFRLAEPEIFHEKYRTYSKDSTATCCAIDLNMNFRSRQPIIDCINTLFYNLMDGYDDKAALYCGNKSNAEVDSSPVFDIISLEKGNSSDDSDVSDETDLFLASLSSNETEALYVANVIKKHIGKTFWDSKNSVYRALEPRDIVILMRNVKGRAQTFYDAAKNVGIDIMIDDIGGYFENLEIDVFINLLNIIDNKKQDIPLISVLHSEIFGFTAAELAKIREENMKGSFFDAFCAYSKGDDEFATRCRNVLESLTEWKHISRLMPLDDFIWKIMLDTGHYISMGAMPFGYQRQMNLRLMVEKAREFSGSGQSGLYAFLDYLKKLKVKKYDLPQSNLDDESDNAVRIMTIHKSKGLEFPMVIVANMSSSLKYTKSRGGVIFQKDAGLGMTYVDKAGKWKKQTVMEHVIERAINADEIEEEKRILYVAMTRARDILYMVGTSKKTSDIQRNAEFKISGVKTYLDMAVPYVPFNIVSMDSYGNSVCAGQDLSPVSKEELMSDDIYKDSADDETKTLILKKLNFEYPYTFARMLKSKYSVSELNSRKEVSTDSDSASVPEIKKSYYADLSVPQFASAGHIYTAAEAGTIYHTVMELIDFAAVPDKCEAYIADSIADMQERGLLLKEEAELIDCSKITSFFNNNLGKRAVAAASAGCLYKERSFTMRILESGESYSVQGIIDCYFEEGDEIVLIDYKTNRIREDRSFESELQRIKDTYEMQIELYKAALEKATGKKVKESYLFLASAGITLKY